MRLRAGFEIARPAASVWEELTADDAREPVSTEGAQS